MFADVNDRRIPCPPTVHEEDPMHPFSVDTAFQLASERRQRLLDQAARRRRLRRRPVAAALPVTPWDAA